MGLITMMSGCTLQPDYSTPALAMPAQWPDAQGARHTSGSDDSIPDRWWTALHDPAIDTLAVAALGDSPTVDEVVSRTDEARAVLRGIGSGRLPLIQANARAARQQSAAAEPGGTERSSVGNAGLGISYELDVFGRVRESVRAARNRVAARSAEVESARLTLVSQVADGVVSLRACAFSQRVRALDIESRTQVLDLTRRRVAAGVDARVEESRARNSLASAWTEAALLNQECEQQTHALHALTGVNSVEVRSVVLGSSEDAPENTPPFMPASPAISLPLPATVVAHHPDLVAADRDAAAAWADIGVARAERLPRIDLGAMLTGNWLRAAGSTLDFTTWSIGPTLAAPLFDGGAGASNVDAIDARYRAAAARLRQTVRRVVQDVEYALAFEDSARVRVSSAQEALGAARDTFLVTERRWIAGATSLFELEDARRQRSAAEDAAIAATRDHVQAWIALMKAVGMVTPPL
jgi:NodT family efflux transporter outer membrane factor (OMF) lipoprotein